MEITNHWQRNKETLAEKQRNATSKTKKCYQKNDSTKKKHKKNTCTHLIHISYTSHTALYACSIPSLYPLYTLSIL